MITYSTLYVLAGLLFAVFSVLSLRDWTNPKRYTTSLFWWLCATCFLSGDLIVDLVPR
ncbi:MAG: 5-oxoproline transporter, DUF979 family subunit, partial [Alphaproteobacteria bacterium]